MEELKKRRQAMRRILWRWAGTREIITRLEEERAYFRARADEARCVLKAQRLTGMPAGGSISDLSDVMVHIEQSVDMYTRQAERINAEIAEALRLRNTVQDTVGALDPVQEKVIRYRYERRYSWKFTAIKMNYDERSARRIEAEAVDKMAEALDLSL